MRYHTPAYNRLADRNDWTPWDVSDVEDEWEALNSPLPSTPATPAPRDDLSDWFDEYGTDEPLPAALVSRLLKRSRPAFARESGPGVGRPLSGGRSGCAHRIEVVDEFTGVLSERATWVFGGSAGDRVRRADCDSPNLLRCSQCDAERSIVCGSRRAKKCGPCEMRYRIRVRSIARMPLQVAQPGSTLLLTVTAPGIEPHCLTHTYQGEAHDGRPVQRPSVICFKPGRSVREGCRMCPCTTPETALGWVYRDQLGIPRRVHQREKIAAWNGTAVARWNDLATDLRRAPVLSRLGGFRGFEFFRAVEPQERGAIHFHVLIKVKRLTLVDDRMRAELTRLAVHHGFGHEVDVRLIGKGAQDVTAAARYCAKYVSKTSDLGSALPMPERPRKDEHCCDAAQENGSVMTARRTEATRFRTSRGTPIRRANPHHLAQSHDHPRKRVRTWFASRGWGLSMGALIHSQRLHASGDSCGSAEALAGALGVSAEVVHRLRSDGAAWRAEHAPPDLT